MKKLTNLKKNKEFEFEYCCSWDCDGDGTPEKPVKSYFNGFILGQSETEQCTYNADNNEQVIVKVNCSNLVSWEIFEVELLGKFSFSHLQII